MEHVIPGLYGDYFHLPPTVLTKSKLNDMQVSSCRQEVAVIKGGLNNLVAVKDFKLGYHNMGV